jgi:hypothetical protein
VGSAEINSTGNSTCRFEMQGVLGAVVAYTSLYDRNSPLCSILCSDSARHAPVQYEPLGSRISRSGLDMVKNIYKERLQFLYRKIPLQEVSTIGIDE